MKINVDIRLFDSSRGCEKERNKEEKTEKWDYLDIEKVSKNRFKCEWCLEVSEKIIRIKCLI